MCLSNISDWWFGTCFILPYIGNHNPNWLIFFRGVETTNQIWCFLDGWNSFFILQLGTHPPLPEILYYRLVHEHCYVKSLCYTILIGKTSTNGSIVMLIYWRVHDYVLIKWRFPKMGVPLYRWMVHTGNPMKIDNWWFWGYPHFRKPPKSFRKRIQQQTKSTDRHGACVALDTIGPGGLLVSQCTCTRRLGPQMNPQKYRGYHFVYKSLDHVTPTKGFVRLHSEYLGDISASKWCLSAEP